LPEGQALDAVAARAGLTINDTFGLLKRYGRDIAGALVVGNDPPSRERWGIETYTDETLAQEVGSLDDHPLGIHDDTEMSLPGLQSKMVLVRQADGTWARPLHGRPSTHILKVEDRRWPGLVEYEAACLSLAGWLELTTITPELRTFDGIPCLVVNRFDRATSDGDVERIHQEDLLQAVGVDPTLNERRVKYQRNNGGGPGLRDTASLLDQHAADPTGELRKLAAILSFTTAIGNGDAHAKNLSFLHDTPESIALAPLYDTVPTIMFRRLAREFAMSVNGEFSYDQVTVKDLVAEAVSWPLSRQMAEAAVTETLEAIREAIADGVVHHEPLSEVISDRTENLLAGNTAH
jgi:serine/threonine-protein kinase HipA